MLKASNITAKLLSSMFFSLVIAASLSNVHAQRPDRPDRDSPIDRERPREREPQTKGMRELAGKIKDEKERPMEGIVVEARTRGCLCSSCTGDDKPCKCCIEQRSVTDATGAYSIKLASRAAVDLVIVREGRVEGRFAGIEASRESSSRERIDLRMDREPRDRERPERDRPERDRP
jgi:hypothetical protein